MIMKQRGLSILLALVFLLSVFMLCTTAFAAENSADGLNAVLTTDKKDYVNGETIGVKLDVTNTSIYVNNVRTELIIPDGVDLVEGQLKSDAAAVTAGQTLSYSYVLSVPKVEVPTTGEGDDGPADTGDTSAVIFGILAVASLAGLIALTFGTKLLKQRWFVLIVCAGLLLGMVAPVAANAAISEKSFELTEAITIDGAAAEVKAIITYDLDDGEILASEVEFKKDGKSLYALVPEKGWYTPSNASIKVDGVAATNNTRPEVTASYIDMLFGCTSTKTGNFVKGEFDNAKIVSDDAELQLLVGLTKDAASRKALAHINYNEWIIAEIDGKVVVTGWFDNATAAAARYLYNLVKDQDNVTLSLPITGKVEGYTTDLPMPTVGTFNGGMDGAEGTMVLSYSDMDEEKFLAYAKDLEDAGFELYAENKILNYGERYNLFRTYTKGESAVHISFLPDDFIHADPATLSANEQAYFSRSFRASGCEMRIVTDSTKHLFNNDAANVYTDAGITPKLHLVNVFNQVADGNNNGECIIYTLADGSFIVADGGFTQDADHIWEALNELNERKDGKIVIAAWILSHDHGDHFGAIKAIAEKEYAKDIIIEKFIFNPVSSTYAWRLVNAPYNYAGSFDANFNHQFMTNLLAKFGGDTQIINPHMGQVMQIRNADVEFLYTGDEDMFPLHMDNTNDASLVYTVNFNMGTETTEDDTRVLMMNDACCDSAYAVLHPLFSRVMDCDIVQVGHHGFGGPSTATYRMMAPSVGIWCTTESTTTKLNTFVPKTNDDGSLAGGTKGGSAGFLVYRSPDDTNPPVDLVLLADKYVQTLELPYTKGDVIDKRILTDYYTGLYAVEEVDVAFLPCFHFRNKFNTKYADILAELESYDADVLILTQADHESKLYPNGDIVNRLLEDLDYTYAYYAPAWGTDYGSDPAVNAEGTAGHMILSRYPVNEAKTLVLVEGTPYYGEDGKKAASYTEGRATCYVQLDVDGLALDVYATHFHNNANWANFKEQFDKTQTGDYWMILGNTQIGGNAATAATKLGMDSVAALGTGDGYNVFADANMEFTNYATDDSFKNPDDPAHVNTNMNVAYTFTAKLSRYYVSDSAKQPTPETDMMYWWINRYGGSKANLETIVNELKYVHPEIAVLAVVDNYSVAAGTPEYLAEQTGYKYSYYVKSWTGSETSERGHMILSDIELQPQEDIILLEDNGPTATEGRAFGHVIMTIDGQEVDVYFGVTDSSTGMVSQLEAIVKANAEASGRQFIVSGYKFASVGTTYAGQKVTNYVIDPGHSIIVSNGDLTVAKKTVRAKTEVGIASAAISDQIWIEFGEPVEEEKPEEDDGITKVMTWWTNSYRSESELAAILQQLKEADADIATILAAGDSRMPSFTLDSFIEQTGYEHWYYVANVTNDNGSSQGCLMLSKTPLTYVDQSNYPNQYGNRYFTHLTTTINNREIDLFMGYDMTPATVESVVKEAVDASGNDFIIFAHNFTSTEGTYAGREVMNVMGEGCTGSVLVSLGNQKVTDTEVVKKADALSWAGHGNQNIAYLEITPKDLTDVMAWWLNGWQNDAHVAAMIEEIKAQDQDIAVIVSAGNFRYADITVEQFAEMTGYEHWYFEPSVTNENGTQRGNLILSKTELTYVDHYETNNVKFSYLTTVLNGRETDLFLGYDVKVSAVEPYIAEKVAASGNDFLVFAFLLSEDGQTNVEIGDTFAGRSVVAYRDPTSTEKNHVYVIASGANQDVVDTFMAPKPEILSWAGYLNQVHMVLDVGTSEQAEEEVPETPEETEGTEVSLLEWWINNPTTADLEKIKTEVKSRNADIVALISITRTSAPNLDPAAYAKEFGYPYSYFVQVTDAGRGNILLSKYPIEFVEQHSEVRSNGTTIDIINYLKVDVNGTKLDVYIGYDCVPAGFQNYIKANAEKTGCDFLLMMKSGWTLANPYAGKNLAASDFSTGKGNNLIAVSLDSLEVVETLANSDITVDITTAAVMKYVVTGKILVK